MISARLARRPYREQHSRQRLPRFLLGGTMRAACLVGLLTSAAVFGFAAPAHGQRTVMLHAGVNFATFGSTDGGARIRSGLDVGADTYFDVVRNVSIQVGVAYSQAGGYVRYLGGPATTTPSSRVFLDYVEVPVLLRYTIRTQGRASVHVLAGSTVDFPTRCRIEIRDGDGYETCATSLGSSHRFNRIDIAATGGFGVGLEATTAARLSFDVLYNLGLRDIDPGPYRVMSRVLRLQAGFALDLG